MMLSFELLNVVLSVTTYGQRVLGLVDQRRMRKGRVLADFTHIWKMKCFTL